MADDIASLGFDLDTDALAKGADGIMKLGTAATGATAQVNKAADAHMLLATEARRAADEFQRATGMNAAFGTALTGIRNQLIATAGGLGLVGSVLATAGTPWLLLAVAIKVAVDAIQFVREESLRMGESAIALRQFADVVGLSIPEVKALKEAGAELGLSGDLVASSFERLTGNMAMARRASGPLFDDLQRVNGGLALQLTGTKTSADAINLLARAYHEAGDQATKANIANAAFGRGGASRGPLLDTIAAAGGIQNLTAATRGLSTGTEQQTRAWAEMTAKIEATELRAKNILASIFTTEGLQAALSAAQFMERLAKAAKDAADARSTLRFGESLNPILPGAEGMPVNPELTDILEKETKARASQVQGVRDALAAMQRYDEGLGEVAVGLNKTTVAALQNVESLRLLQDAAATAARLDKERVAGLGAAATIDEQRNAKLKELTSLLLDHKLAQQDYDRAVAATTIDARVQKDALRITQLGELAPVLELNRQKEDALAKSIRDGARFSDTELAAMRERNRLLTEAGKIENQLIFDRAQIFKTQADQSTDALLRANGIPPASDRAAAIRDYMRMTDVLKQVQDASGTFLSGFATDLSHGVTATNALHNALTRLSDLLIDMASKRLVAMALQGLTGALLPGIPGAAGAGAGVSNAAAGVLPGFAGGGSLSHGWGIVGERGRELINVTSEGASIYSNPVSRQMLATFPGFADGGFMDNMPVAHSPPQVSCGKLGGFGPVLH